METTPKKGGRHQKPLTAAQKRKRSRTHSQTYQKSQKARLKDELQPQPAVMTVQVDGHYVTIKKITGKDAVLIVPFAAVKKILRSKVFYLANPSTLVNLYHVEEMLHYAGATWLILPQNYWVKLSKTDAKTRKYLHLLLFGNWVMQEIKRLHRKIN